MPRARPYHCAHVVHLYLTSHTYIWAQNIFFVLQLNEDVLHSLEISCEGLLGDKISKSIGDNGGVIVSSKLFCVHVLAVHSLLRSIVQTQRLSGPIQFCDVIG